MDEDKKILSGLVKNMSKKAKDPLRPMVDKYLMTRENSEERIRKFMIDMQPRTRPGGRLSPSTIGGCMRQAAFKFLNVKGKRRVDPDLELIFEDGNWRHHKWQAMFLDMQAVLGEDVFKVLYIEKPVYIPELYVAGYTDAAVYIKGFGEAIVDFKGINSMGFSKVHMDNAPHLEHARQGLIYCKAADIDRLIISYDDKNTQRTHNYVIVFNEAKLEEVETWCRKTIAYMRDRELPPKHPGCARGNFMFEKCPWSSLCFGKLEKEEVTDLAYKDFIGVKKSWKAGMKELEVE